MKPNKEANKAMRAARSSLIMDHPFFAVLVMQLKLVEAPQIKTMATDGKCLFYNPDFVLELPERQRIGAIAHEGYHCAWRHHTRLFRRNHKKWNIATDYVINNDLLAIGFALPEWVYKDPAYIGMTADEVYTLIPEQASKQGGQGKGQGKSKGDKAQGPSSGGDGQQGPTSEQADDPGQLGGVMAPAPAWDQQTIAKEDAKWERIARQAVNAAKQRNAGRIPGYLQRLVTELEDPKINWKSVMRDVVDSTVQRTSSWCRPKRRYVPMGYIFPGAIADGVDHGISLMDTSGSVSQDLLNQYAAEQQALLDEEVLQRLTVIYTDSTVHNIKEFEQGDIVKLDPHGGGGTNFRPAMAYVREHYPDASVVLFFTDLMTSDFGDEPNCPVLWLAYGIAHARYQTVAPKVPFGETVFVGM